MKTVKRIAILLCIAAFLIPMAALPVGAEVHEYEYVRGDANSDGQVDIRDVTMVQRVISELENDPNSVVERNCDVDDDGLSITDGTCMQRYLAEFADPYSIGKLFTYEDYELPFIHV